MYSTQEQMSNLDRADAREAARDAASLRNTIWEEKAFKQNAPSFLIDIMNRHASILAKTQCTLLILQTKLDKLQETTSTGLFPKELNHQAKLISKFDDPTVRESMSKLLLDKEILKLNDGIQEKKSFIDNRFTALSLELENFTSSFASVQQFKLDPRFKMEAILDDMSRNIFLKLWHKNKSDESKKEAKKLKHLAAKEEKATSLANAPAPSHSDLLKLTEKIKKLEVALKNQGKGQGPRQPKKTRASQRKGLAEKQNLKNGREIGKPTNTKGKRSFPSKTMSNSKKQ